KGMAQKVQVIAAIAHDPEFLVLDEPFSGLDPVNQKLLESMVRSASKRGRTVIFSTHVMEHAERLCDKIILMSKGEKIFDGDLKQALKHAPRHLLISVRGKAARDILHPFTDALREPSAGEYQMFLKSGIESHTVLEACMGAGLKLLRFEPDPPSLHDAFVALVGEAGQEISS
ncbi:MAG TPA: ABC transporter ATP-binding protein, partial [Hellea balneolensis]|nr:ABC transporter ATP-binding protein [Hellea balneolensis]